jgi:glycosyltransferase involved in cell wall biosynthesis
MITVTFIIPTIGRESLKNSIQSLKNQTIKTWNAIIIFDGIKCNIDEDDNRVKIVEIEKAGRDYNSAGDVRNYGMSLVDTEWIAFLDDDDTLSYDYIETFYREIELYPYIDTLIFRMKLNERFVPDLNTNNFYICDVGISFIIKTQIFKDGIKFSPSGAEDFYYLDNIRKNNYIMIISPYVKYFVRENSTNHPTEDAPKGNRIIINNINPLITLFGYNKLI